MQKQDNHSLRTYFLDQVNQNEGAREGFTRQSLGVGALIGGSFSITFRHRMPVLLIGFVISLLGAFLTIAVVDINAALGLEGDGTSDLGGYGDLVTAFIDVLVFSVMAACLAQLTYDAKLNRPISITRYLLPALRASPAICLQNSLLLIFIFLIALPPVIVTFSFDSTLISLVPLVALPFLALWGCSVFLVLVPAVVIERAGFGGLRRSWSLTKTYRWQIAGALLAVWLYSVVVALAGALPVELLAREGRYAFAPQAGLFAGQGRFAWALPVYAATNALANGPLAILASLVYVRLREIKEGTSVDQVADVFD
ncbi:hypothetical protein FMN63_09305 [Stappia sp. BW2]|uniref:hypothetical protein n=1 Tax=Stappia sp. BW2 TaxID=2592622 RepID=UPI0011DE7865|nr:hypothetical protein [Stappia sp. BW2]TYC70093.1 hypothetical protein FMN63_09305 [Stappia sp. BW2]